MEKAYSSHKYFWYKLAKSARGEAGTTSNNAVLISQIPTLEKVVVQDVWLTNSFTQTSPIFKLSQILTEKKS